MRITEALEGSEPVFSFEFFPPKTPEGFEQLFETVETLRPLEPDCVSVTYGAGGSTRDGTVDIARRIKEEHGIEAMAHLSCVGETREGLTAILDRLADAGVENILALRGDPPRGETVFEATEGGLRSATELIELIASGPWDFTIGGACFPEVHPEAASLDDDLRYLRTKVDAGASFLITQLFFDNAVYWSFVEAARDAGITVPIIPGVIPIASYAQVARICAMCDASLPAELDEAMRALGGDTEAESLLGVAYASRQCEELLAGGAPGIQFYPLNRAPATRAVLSALRASRPWERARPREEASA